MDWTELTQSSQDNQILTMAQARAISVNNQNAQPVAIRVPQSATIIFPIFETAVNSTLIDADEIHGRWFVGVTSVLKERSRETDAQRFTLNVSEVIETRIEDCKTSDRIKLVFMCWLSCGVRDSWEWNIQDICEGFFEDKETWERGNLYPQVMRTRKGVPIMVLIPARA